MLVLSAALVGWGANLAGAGVLVVLGTVCCSV